MTDDLFQVPRKWWKSRTVIGLALSVAAKAAALVDIHIDPQAHLVEVLLLTSLVGDFIAGYGRKKAEGPLVR